MANAYHLGALKWLLAATLARTFKDEAELRRWGEDAINSVLANVEKQPDQQTAQCYRETFDQVLSKAIELHEPSHMAGAKRPPKPPR